MSIPFLSLFQLVYDSCDVSSFVLVQRAQHSLHCPDCHQLVYRHHMHCVQLPVEDFQLWHSKKEDLEFVFCEKWCSIVCVTELDILEHDMIEIFPFPFLCCVWLEGNLLHQLVFSMVESVCTIPISNVLQWQIQVCSEIKGVFPCLM